MKDFNIKNGTIKLGTLHEYRETEIKYIKDTHEGHLKFHISFNGEVEISRENFNTLNQGSVQYNEGGLRFPGKSRVTTNMSIVGTTPDTVFIKDSDITIDLHTPNIFIYCMSAVKKPVDCIGIFPEYDDYWFISREDEKQFATELGNSLLQEIRAKKEQGIYIIPQNIQLKECTIGINISEVTYASRETTFSYANDKKEIDEFIKKMTRIAFIKPPEPFSKEREYRFSLSIIHNNKIIEPLVKSIIINSARLLPMTKQPEPQ